MQITIQNYVGADVYFAGVRSCTREQRRVIKQLSLEVWHGYAPIYVWCSDLARFDVEIEAPSIHRRETICGVTLRGKRLDRILK